MSIICQIKKQSSFHWPSNPIFHSTPWPLWTLPWPRYHQHLHKNCGGQDRDSKCRGSFSQPRNCSKKTIRLRWCLTSCVFLGWSSQRWNWDSTSWRSTVPLLNILLGEGFPYSKSVVSTTQLARLTENLYTAPRWLEANMIRCQGSQRENFETNLWCLLVVLYPNENSKTWLFSDTLLMGKKSAPVDMVNI